jgi:hypothetical protein
VVTSLALALGRGLAWTLYMYKIYGFPRGNRLGALESDTVLPAQVPEGGTGRKPAPGTRLRSSWKTLSREKSRP